MASPLTSSVIKANPTLPSFSAPEPLISTSLARCVHVFPSHSTGFKDGRKDELFPPLVDLSTPAERVCGGLELLAADKTMGVGAALEIGGGMGIFPSGITRLLVAGPDGATGCLWRQSFSVNWSCKQEYEVFDNTMAKTYEAELSYEMPRADHCNFGGLSPER